MSYKEKYLKYKTKYSLLKEQKGGGGNFLTGDDYKNDPSYGMFNFSNEFLEKDLDVSILYTSFFHCYAEMYVSFYHLGLFYGNRKLYTNFLTKFILVTYFFRIALDLTKTINDQEIQIYNKILSSSFSINPKNFLSELTSINYDKGDGTNIFDDDIYPVDKELELWYNLEINFPMFKEYIQKYGTLTTYPEQRDNDLDYDRSTFESNKQRLLDKKGSLVPIDPVNSKPFLDYLKKQILIMCRHNFVDVEDIAKDYYINIKRREQIVVKMNDNITGLTHYRNKIYDMFRYEDYFPKPGMSPPSKLQEVNKRLTIIGYSDLMYQLKKNCIS